MAVPLDGDLINLHTHDSVRTRGVFAVENLMLHEGRLPDNAADAFSVGVHPWFLQKENLGEQLSLLAQLTDDERVIAVGEAGYDRRRGAGVGLQQEAFEAQAQLAEDKGKPLVIHCVKGWDELWASKRRLKPQVPWIIHGFNGGIDQARQLVAGGMYLSLWVKSVLNGALDPVIAGIPHELIFLETDGFEVDLALVYEKAAQGVNIPVGLFADTIRNNYLSLFV
ncbi:MAG: TatD family hydrolase [Bacteroidales bacterium]